MSRIRDLYRRNALVFPRANGSLSARLANLFGANMLVLFDMSEGSGTTLVNKGSSGTGQNATLTGGVVWASSLGGNLLGSLDYDGTTGNVSFTLPTMTENHCIITVYRADTHGESGNGFVWFQGANYQQRFLGTSARVSNRADYTTTDAVTVGVNGTTNLNNDVLNFYQLTSSNKTLRMYLSVNGGAVAESAYQSQTLGVGTYVAPSGTFYLGNNNLASNTFDGKIGLFMIINRALTAGERTSVRSIINL